MKYNQPYGVSDPNAPYTNGNPSTGTMGSIPPAASIEYPQREIVAVIADAGMTPTDGDLTQLAKAIQSGKLIYADDMGGVNQLVVTLAPNVAGNFGKGFTVVTKAAQSNTGPSTLSINGAGAWPIVHQTDQTQLAALDISQNGMYAFVFDGANFQLVWSSRQPGAPVFLNAPRDYYVNGTTGNDNYDGQSATYTTGIHGPFATLQRAANVIPQFNMNGYSISFHVADYTYQPFLHPKINGSGFTFWQGNPANPAACVINGINRSAVIAGDIGGTIYMDGFKVQCSGSQAGDGICSINVIGAGTIIILGAMEFGPAVGAHISTQRGALVSNYTPGCIWKITGSATGNAYVPGCFIFSYVGGASFITHSGGGPALQIPAVIGFNGAFISCSNNALVSFPYASLTGGANVSGRKYNCQFNSTIQTGSGDVNYYPGSVAGIVANGGYYL